MEQTTQDYLKEAVRIFKLIFNTPGLDIRRT